MATSYTTLFVILNTNYIKIASSLEVLVQIRRVLCVPLCGLRDLAFGQPDKVQKDKLLLIHKSSYFFNGMRIVHFTVNAFLNSRIVEPGDINKGICPQSSYFETSLSF